MKRKSSHDSLTGKELAEMILRLLEKDDKGFGVTLGDALDTIHKIRQICQDVIDEW